MYDYIFITPMPAFYKVNLYNELAKKLNIYVIFLGKTTSEKRADDFANLQNLSFEYKIIHQGDFQSRNKGNSIIQIYNILRHKTYQKIALGGWDLLESWFVLAICAKQKNCLILESSIVESKTTGFLAVLKKLFLKRISLVFAAGNAHKKLLNALNYKSESRITKGVGIINKPDFKKIKKSYQQNFLYIGRLSAVKNLAFLIAIFNHLPEHTLSIIGDGEDKKYLQNIAKANIRFISSVANQAIKDVFLQHDVFILPSISEPWGLVVEEALYFGLPVMVSSHCGASCLITDNINGFIINPYNKDEVKNSILSINKSNYLTLQKAASTFDINNKDKQQAAQYVN